VNALCYLLDWKCSIYLETVSLMLVDLTFQLFWKNARVKHFSCSPVNYECCFSFFSIINSFELFFCGFMWFQTKLLEVHFVEFVYRISTCHLFQICLHVDSCCRDDLLLQLTYALFHRLVQLEYRTLFYHI
jgi:hypothetical protein